MLTKEPVLHRHPKAQEVCLAGVPSVKTCGAVKVKAYIVLSVGEPATAGAIIKYCQDRRSGLTGFPLPVLVEFRPSAGDAHG